MPQRRIVHLHGLRDRRRLLVKLKMALQVVPVIRLRAVEFLETVEVDTILFSHLMIVYRVINIERQRLSTSHKDENILVKPLWRLLTCEMPTSIIVVPFLFLIHIRLRCSNRVYGRFFLFFGHSHLLFL